MLTSRNIPAFLESELRSAADSQPHWSSSSQTYAPADVLLQSLAEGWTLSPVIGQEEHLLGGGRRISVYYFELCKGDRQIVMQVHGNPVVRRLIRENALKIVLINRDESVRFPRPRAHV